MAILHDKETGLYYLQSRYYNPETGRFLNADGFVTTGQGVLGSNMFTYCLNNPINLVDYTGNSAVAAVLKAAAISAVVNGLLDAACAFVTGQSKEAVLEAFVEGAGFGALTGVLPQLEYVAAAWDALGAMFECLDSGVSLGGSLLVGCLTFFTSLIGYSEAGKAVELLVNVTLGFGGSLVTESIQEALKIKAEQANIIMEFYAPEVSPPAPNSTQQGVLISDTRWPRKVYPFCSVSLHQVTLSSRRSFAIPIVSNNGWRPC